MPDSDRAFVTARNESHILFVGTRNTARSAAADLIAKQRFGDLGLTFESAGVNVVDGCGIADDVQEALARRQIDATAHVARQIDREIVERSGLILALDGSHRRFLLESWPGVATRMALLSEAAAVAGWATAGRVTTSRASHGVSQLDGTGRHTGAPTAHWLVRQCTRAPSFDVTGPDRAGDHDGEAAVRQIDDALSVLLPWYARALGG